MYKPKAYKTKAAKRASVKRYRGRNKEKVKKFNQRYAATHKKELAAKNKAWREANRDELLKRKRDYYWANRASLLETRKRANKLNSETINKKRRHTYALKRESVLENSRRWRRAHPENWEQYYAAHRGEILARLKVMYENHREEIRAKENGKRARSPEFWRKYQRDYYAKNRERCIAYTLKHVKANHAKVRKNERDRSAHHPERAHAKRKRYHKAHPEASAASVNRRRARKRNNLVGNLKEIRRIYKHVREVETIPCYWCKTLIPKGDRVLDHVIPLARNGAHAPANLCSSHNHCNHVKGSRMPEEISGQYEFSLA